MQPSASLPSYVHLLLIVPFVLIIIGIAFFNVPILISQNSIQSLFFKIFTIIRNSVNGFEQFITTNR